MLPEGLRSLFTGVRGIRILGSSRSWTRTCPGSWAGRSGSIRAFVTAKLDTTWRRADHMLVPPAGPSTVHLTRAPSRPRDALSCRDLMGGFGGFGGSPIPQPTRVRARAWRRGANIQDSHQTHLTGAL